MKRFHIHIGVDKLDDSIRFYSALFGAEPVKTKPDYAKWMLEDPRLNFAISTRAKTKGMDHLGIQVDEEHELTELRERLKAGDMAITEEGEPSAVTPSRTNLGFKIPQVFRGKPTEPWKMPSSFPVTPTRLRAPAVRRRQRASLTAVSHRRKPLGVVANAVRCAQRVGAVHG